jgi:hypothetical protein
MNTVSFFCASKRKKNGFSICVAFLNAYYWIRFLFEKKAGKKTSAVLKMPNPRSQDWLRKTILNLNDILNHNIYESRFSH